MKDLGLNNLQKIKEMRDYITQKIDPYVKPLIIHLMKTKPASVHEEIKKWIDKEGLEVKSKIENNS